MIVYTDGRPTKVAFIVERNDGRILDQKIIPIPYSTNFEAEYRAIIEALKYIARTQITEPIMILNDNATVIGQLLGKARVLEPRIKALFDEAVSYIATYNVQFGWIERERNKAHDLFR